MTAKDKAKELISKFLPLAHKNFNRIKDGELDKTKQIAIICCEEIINTKNYPNTLHPDMTDWSNKYWENVIIEIKNYEQ